MAATVGVVAVVAIAVVGLALGGGSEPTTKAEYEVAGRQHA